MRQKYNCAEVVAVCLSQVILWDMVKYKVVRHLEGHCHDVCGCDFSPDGALLATASYDTSVIVWDPHIGTKLLLLRSVILHVFLFLMNGLYFCIICLCVAMLQCMYVGNNVGELV